MGIGIGLATLTATTEFLWSSRRILNSQNSDKFSNLKKEALSSFGRKGVKFNLNKSTSVLSSMSDVSTAQRMQPRRPTLKKSVATINSSDGDTLKEGTPAEKRVMIIIDGNSPSSSETTSSSSCLSSSSSSSEAKESTAT